MNNDLRDPGSYFTRKGSYALNCQMICDAKKRILWLSSNHIGSAHDSRAFKDTQMYTLLLEKKAFLYKNISFLRVTLFILWNRFYWCLIILQQADRQKILIVFGNQTAK